MLKTFVAFNRENARLIRNLTAFLVVFTFSYFALITHAEALVFDTIVDDLNAWINEQIIAPVINGMLGFMSWCISALIDGSILNQPFENLLGDSSGTASLYTLISQINNIVIKPIAAAILALVLLLQLVKISQKVDANATMPAVKEVMFLFVFCILFMWLINHSMDICKGIYDITKSITDGILGIHALNTTNMEFVYDTSLGVGDLLFVLIMALIVMLVLLVTYVVALFCAYGRAIQIYLLAAFSPLPFSLLGFEETRSWGVGFFKNFTAICLAGAIMILLLIAFPYVIAGAIGGINGGMTVLTIGSGADTLLALLGVVAASLVLAFGMFKSGAWARDILGS